MVTLDELDQMRKIEIGKADKTKLIDIQTIKIDTSLSKTERMESYLAQIKNPYLFLCDDTVIQIKFASDGNSLSSKLKSHFISIKEN